MLRNFKCYYSLCSCKLWSILSNRYIHPKSVHIGQFLQLNCRQSVPVDISLLSRVGELKLFSWNCWMVMGIIARDVTVNGGEWSVRACGAEGIPFFGVRVLLTLWWRSCVCVCFVVGCVCVSQFSHPPWCRRHISRHADRGATFKGDPGRKSWFL